MTCEAAFIKGVIPSELGIFKSIPSSIRIFKVLRSPWATANIAADLESKVRTDGVKILEEDEHTQPKFKLEKKMFIQKCVLHNNNNDKIVFSTPRRNSLWHYSTCRIDSLYKPTIRRSLFQWNLKKIVRNSAI